MKVILNEKKYVEDCLKYGRINNKPGRTLALMAQYYYDFGGYRKKKIAELLVEFMRKYYRGFDRNEKDFIKMCEGIANRTGGVALLEIDGLKITRAEIDAISALNNKKLEKLAFAFLCLQKVENARLPGKVAYISNDLKEVFEYANIETRKTNGRVAAMERLEMVNQLYTAGLLEFRPQSISNDIRVTCLNEDSETVMVVSDFRQLGYQYQQYKGAKVCNCVRCGVAFRPRKGKSDKYCSDACAHAVKTKELVCVDCGVTFITDARSDVRQCRCERCQKVKVREDNRRRKQKQRSKWVVMSRTENAKK